MKPFILLFAYLCVRCVSASTIVFTITADLSSDDVGRFGAALSSSAQNRSVEISSLTPALLHYQPTVTGDTTTVPMSAQTMPPSPSPPDSPSQPPPPDFTADAFEFATLNPVDTYLFVPSRWDSYACKSFPSSDADNQHRTNTSFVEVTGLGENLQVSAYLEASSSSSTGRHLLHWEEGVHDGQRYWDYDDYDYDYEDAIDMTLLTNYATLWVRRKDSIYTSHFVDTAYPVDVSNGDKLLIKLCAPDTFDTERSVTLRYGNVSDTITIKTIIQPSPPPPSPPRLLCETGLCPPTQWTSAAQWITCIPC